MVRRMVDDLRGRRVWIPEGDPISYATMEAVSLAPVTLPLSDVLTGLQTGALYALTAVGFSLIFGSTRIFHFAHGATFVIAAYFFYAAFGAG